MKEIFYSLRSQWVIAAIATAIIILVFELGPSSDLVILGSPIAVAVILTCVGWGIFSKEIVVGILEKFNILILFAPLVAIPTLLFTFLHQSQYGSMILILGIFNIGLVTFLQAAEVFVFTFLLKKAFHKLRVGM